MAITPPAEVVGRLAETMRGLLQAIPSGVAWTPPEKIHLTLVFLGHMEEEKLGPITADVENACLAASPFTLHASGLGCFPGLRRPRIVWAGLQGQIEPLERIKTKLEQDFEKFGYVPEKRVFRPHLTIGRVKDPPRDLGRVVEAQRERDFGEWQVGGIDLMQSVLAPTGAKYSVLRRINFC